VNLLNLNGNGMSAPTSMNESSLSFSKTAAVQTGEEIVEEELLTEHDDSFIDLEDQNIEKLHIGDKEVVAISNGVCAGSSPWKLKCQPIQEVVENLPSKGY
jgi:hypothetical protein